MGHACTHGRCLAASLPRWGMLPRCRDRACCLGAVWLPRCCLAALLLPRCLAASVIPDALLPPASLPAAARCLCGAWCLAASSLLASVLRCWPHCLLCGRRASAARPRNTAGRARPSGQAAGLERR
eukprot:353818-Prymnesium_polylepis.1